LTTWGGWYINRKKLFKQIKDSSKVDIEHFREFRKGVRNCKVFKARKEKGVLRKTLIEMGWEV